ncbi:DUF6058 family natural product biosynthesis protein [Pseudoalteromonas fenneropenaei]|uniref:DUF6058 family natural product biosynthesis protein n=1 Tax=Pseudoalteromonas fenneropenaei TaxID=1737459 RepID=A0ABV7CMN0_9GAMM
MSLTHYLTTHFYTTTELCAALRIDASQLEQWQEAKLFPKPSYCLQNHIKCSSYLGFYECEEWQDYYPRGAANWGQTLLKQKVMQASSAFELFAQSYLATLSKVVQQGVECQDPRFSDELDDHLQQVWQQYLCSKYGVISQNGLVEEVVYIDLGRAIVDEVTEERAKVSLSVEERSLLLKGIKLLNRGLSHHAAHEKHDSLRYHYVDAILQKYDLTIR